MHLLNCLCGVVSLVLCAGVASLWADDDFERPPVSYSDSTPDNRVSRLQAQLDKGEITLESAKEQGYLPALLKALQVPVESQVLVFSKTSLQTRYISPRTPRAIYFNDEVYIGYCQSGDVLEISAVDAQLGTVFYTLDQQSTDKPVCERRTENCLVCHSSSRTEGVPGHLVRSLLVDTKGYPLFSSGSRVIDHATPLQQRWGGWYVTGTHGAQTHLGNLVIRGKDTPRPIDNTQGQNVVALKDRLNVDKYLTPHSDLIALMILEHQVLVQNRLTKANFVTRFSLAEDAQTERSPGQSPHELLASTRRRIANAGDELVDALLLVGEAKLEAPLRGTSGFAEKFARAGLRDGQGRSLRELELTSRLFKYPCSYLIDSEAFEKLPREVRDYVWQRLGQILSGADGSKKFAHLTPADRKTLLEILRDTSPSVPEHWPQKSPLPDKSMPTQ